MKEHIFAQDPFTTIDIRGVGSLIQLAIEKIRRVNPKIKISLCGEHSSDPASIKFLTELSLDAISCAPYKLPIAKIAAAQAHILEIQSKFLLY